VIIDNNQSMTKPTFILALFIGLTMGCQTPNPESEVNEQTMIKAPIAKKIAKEMTIHEDTRVDNYFWMRLSDEQKESKTPDAQTQDVLDNLNAENDFLKESMAHTDDLQKNLYEEIVARIKQEISLI